MSNGLHAAGRAPLGLIALLAATGLALALAGGSGSGHAVDAGEATTALDPEALVRISVEREPVVADRVETLRGLEFGDVPEPEVVSAERLGRIEDREIRESGGEPPIAADEAAARILGLLGADEQLEAAQGATDQLAAAAYDPETKRLYVIDDAVGASPALVEFVLAHELTHAIEDQAFGLPDLTKVADDDRALAGLALTEGSATSMMVRYAERYLNALALSIASAGIDDDTGEVPKFVVEQLEWAYLQGMRFVDQLHDVTDGWKLVDYAIANRPPVSSEQILHVAKYLRDQRPLPVAIDARDLTDRGWERAGGGVLGEYGTRQILRLGLSGREAATGADAWGGDRYELWRRATAPADCEEADCRRSLVLVVRWRTDGGDAGEAQSLAASLGGYLTQALGAESDRFDSRGGVFRVDGGWAVVATGGGDSALVFAPERDLAEDVAAANGGG